MARIDNLTNFLTDVATAIKGKTGKTDAITPSNFDTEIASIQSGGGDTSIEDGLINGTLQNYSNNRITNVRDYTFYKVTSLKIIDLPMVDTLGSYSFSGCTGLTEINIPSVSIIHSTVFYKCSKLTKVILPSLTQIQGNGFSECTKLASVDCHKKVMFNGTSIFKKCYALTTLILRASTVCDLYNTNIFDSTPIENGTGYIYVPDNLVDSYKSATNWSNFADQIKPISELEGNQ